MKVLSSKSITIQLGKLQEVFSEEAFQFWMLKAPLKLIN